MSVWVVESNGELYKSTVGWGTSRRARHWMFASVESANAQLTRLLNLNKGRDKRKKALNLCVVEYVRKES